MVLFLLAVGISSLGFVLEYVFYRQSYQQSQQQEKEKLHYKVEHFLRDLTSYLTLTQARLEATRKDPQTLQNILISLTHLMLDTTVLPFQRVLYEKRTAPMYAMDRFAVKPLETPTPLGALCSHQKYGIQNQEGVIKIRMLVAQEDVLEIQITLEAFQSFLNPSSTIALNKSFLDFKDPDMFFKRPPLSGWAYGQQEKQRYSFLMGLAFIVLSAGAGILNKKQNRLQQTLNNRVLTLTHVLSAAEQKLDRANSQLAENQKLSQSIQTSRQALGRLQQAIHQRQQERAQWVALSLDVLQQSYTNPTLSISEKEGLHMMDQCLKEVRSLSLGAWRPENTESINLTALIAHSANLFQEKIYKSKITLEQNFPENLPCIQGDRLFIEFLLANILGKALHRVPKEGVVSLSIERKDHALHFIVKDQGYQSVGNLEKFIKKSFDLFLTDDRFQSTCRENGLGYQGVYESSGMNIMCLVFPTPAEEIVKNNVVSLFNV